MHTQTLIVIPARFASKRFPQKPLASIKGCSLLERVWKIAKSCRYADRVVIATDSEIIAEHAGSFNAEVIMSPTDCATGTDRVAWIANKLSSYELIFSFQGDAVLTPPWVVDEILKHMQEHPEVRIATPAVKLIGQAKQDFISLKQSGSSRGTSVVFDKHHNALYFSKALLPYSRDGYDNIPIYRHIGLYGYQKSALTLLTSMPQSPLELSEHLEQLRALENNLPIRVIEVDYKGRTHASIDHPDDVSVVESLIQTQGELV